MKIVIVLDKSEISALLNEKVIEVKPSKSDCNGSDILIVEKDKWHRDLENGNYKDYMEAIENE